MKNVVVTYWSGTGNTEAMAKAVGEGALADAVAVKVMPVGSASKAAVLEADAVALGCPAMGAEVLEELEMEPFVQLLEKENLKDKPMVLFGSYDWGDGQWMRDWQGRMNQQGVRLLAEGLIINNAPDEAGLSQCRELGAKLRETLIGK
jgi:flavodoxin I